VATILAHRRLARHVASKVALPGGAVCEQAALSIVRRHLREFGLRELKVRKCLLNIRRVVARCNASSSARRAKPSAAAATEVRNTSSVRIAT